MPNLRWHAAALALYTAAAWALLDHGLSLSQNILGEGTDPLQFVWFLAWWPHALAHHLNPFYTHLLWQPVGLNLAWATSVPALALLAMPLTALFGPVVSLNLLILAAPIAAAFAAYGLCFYLTRRPLAAWLGGYLFGFSAYEMAQSTEHLNLAFTVCVPLLVWLAWARLDGALSRARFVIPAALLLACQFAISIEVFATGLFFAGAAWALAVWLLPSRRPALAAFVADTIGAVLLAALLLSPMLWVMFTYPHSIKLPALWPAFLSTDLLNLAWPTSTTLLGMALPDHFPGFLAEQNGYLGAPLLVILWRYGRQNRFAAALMVTVLLCSLGPLLWVFGVPTGVPMPWSLFWHLPLLGSALPARFMLFASLVAALCVSLWVAARPNRLVWGALAALFLLPAPHKGEAIPASTFFSPGRVEAVLGPNPVLLVIPFDIRGPSTYWQAEAGFSYTQTGGYLGFPPAWAQTDQPMMAFFFGTQPGLSTDFAAYCERTHTSFVVAGPGTSGAIMAGLRGLGWPEKTVDDVVIFSVPSEGSK